MPLNGKLGRKEKFYAIEWDSGGKKGKCQLVLTSSFFLSFQFQMSFFTVSIGSIMLFSSFSSILYSLLFCMIV